MSKGLQLSSGPINIVVLDAQPVGFILDGTNPERVDANEQDAMRGDGKVLGAGQLSANIELGDGPILLKTEEIFSPPFKTLLPVVAIIVAVVAWNNEGGSWACLEDRCDLLVWLRLAQWSSALKRSAGKNRKRDQCGADYYFQV